MDDYLGALGQDLTTAYSRVVERRRWRNSIGRIGLMASAGALVLAGVAFGAASLFGSPAPPSVKNDLAAVDRGMPADLALADRGHIVAPTSVAAVASWRGEARAGQ